MHSVYTKTHVLSFTLDLSVDSNKETSVKDDKVHEGGESSSTSSGMWSVIGECGYMYFNTRKPFHFRHGES